MGAQHVLFVTREGDESEFMKNVMLQQYGFDPALVEEIHGTGPNGGSRVDLEDADAALVARWDSIKDPYAMMGDGLNAPIYVNPDKGLGDLADEDPTLKKRRYEIGSGA